MNWRTIRVGSRNKARLDLPQRMQHWTSPPLLLRDIPCMGGTTPRLNWITAKRSRKGSEANLSVHAFVMALKSTADVSATASILQRKKKEKDDVVSLEIDDETVRRIYYFYSYFSMMFHYLNVMSSMYWLYWEINNIYFTRLRRKKKVRQWRKCAMPK